ncbi:Marine sediment metagenome DNA, contig: S12H4_L01240 (Fragment) OS=marine sediment metagenome GN=S12H4_15080 PE=4 SV=1 [Gemmata massiliana]|uniref:Marine sediment metagenome DNA, contig: S12H4_L01240 n=1 Tax=Gemmata massiliana TaxID=1210884 RepID=A0A6P2CY33_9BACT
MRGLCFLVASALTVGVIAAPVPAPTPKFELGKDTTYLTGPLDAEGFVDYETALNERLRGKIEPGENAVSLLVEAIGPKLDGKKLHPDFFKWLGTEPLPENGEYLIGAAEFFGEERRQEGFFEREGRRMSEPWTAEDDPKFAEWLAKNEKPLAKATEAAKRKHYFCPLVARTGTGARGSLLVAAMMGPPSGSRQIVQLLSARVMLRCGEKKYDAAWQDILSIYRLGRLTSRSGTLIGSLVGISFGAVAEGKALALLESSKPSAKQARQFRDDLLALPPPMPLAEVYDGYERFGFLDSLREYRRKGVRAVPFLKDEEELPTEERTEASMSQIDWGLIQRTGNGALDKAVAACRLPTHAARMKALTEVAKPFLPEGPNDANPFDVLKTDDLVALLKETDPKKLRTTVSETLARRVVRDHVLVFDKIATSVDRAEQTHRNLLVAVALAGHLADTGKYPTKLADLAPKYLVTVSDDLFSGKPLVYKPANGGYLFYSVGVNGADDGGKLFNDHLDERGDDIGVRMPRSNATDR